MDGAQLLWKGKPARLAKGAIGRRITDTMATDGRTLYFAQKRVDTPPGLRLDALRMRVFNENPVNLFGAILDDGDAVWYLNQVGATEIRPLPGADFDTVQRFETVGVHHHHHLRDRRHVWYRGALLEGLAAERAIVRSEHCVSDGDRVWIFGQPSDEYRHADLTPLCSDGRDDFVRTDAALLRFDARAARITTVATAAPQSSTDAVAQMAMQALCNDMFAVFDMHPQIIVPVGDMDWERVRARPSTPIDARFDGTALMLRADGVAPITCEPDGWYRGICRLWLRLRGLPGEYLSYPSLGIMLPDGQEFRQRLIKENADSFLQFCGAAFRQGAERSARLMLHSFVYAGRFRQDTPFDGLEALAASLPRRLFDGVTYVDRRFGFKSTTNLAAARHAVTSGLLADADPRVRLEMLELIHATVLETNKVPHFCKHVLPAVLQRRQEETVAAVLEHTEMVIEAFIIAGLVQAEVSHTPCAGLLEPLVSGQIARGVNVVLNRARLIELLLHQGRETEAMTAVAAFKADFGAGFMLPGLYVNRPLHTTVDEAVAAMRERAAELR